MAELYSQYASGNQFTAGPIVGSALGVSGANAIVDRLNSISDTDSKILPAVTTPITPIGAVIAWLKSFTNTPNLPDGWVECDGSVLSDGDSVYDGQTLPDLNGDNRFLRGNSTSGGTGGQDVNSHTHSATTSAPSATLTYLSESGSTYATGSHTHTVNTSVPSDTENRPPFYNVVWIFRFK